MARYRTLRKIACGMLSLGVAACGNESTGEDLQPKGATEATAEFAREQGAAALQALEGLYDDAKEAGEEAVPVVREQGAVAWEALKDLYDDAKEAGEEAAPDGIVQAIKGDIALMGDWEYRIEDVSSDRSDRTEMLKKLNEWGADRWEVYWIETIDTGYTLHLKRAGRSYLRMIPVGSVLQAVPGGG